MEHKYTFDTGHIWKERHDMKRGREADFTENHWYHRFLIRRKRLRTKPTYDFKGYWGARAECCGYVEREKED